MAQVPNKVIKFKTLEDDLSTSVATALWKKAADLTQYINQSRPIGMLMYFHNNQILLPELPDPKYWKLCDGTAVSNPLSPLNGVVVPNLLYVYLKHPADGYLVFGFAGADTRDLTHSHGGITGYTFPGGSHDADDDNERAGPFTHAHSISNGSGNVSVMPPYIEMRVYMRIV